MKNSLIILRISLAFVFFWFGLLKLFNVSPVFDIIANAYPFMAHTPFLYTSLAILEILIGIGFLLGRFLNLVCWVTIAHLCFATIGVLISPQAFSGVFPLLSIIGEFVIKNLVLIAAAFVLTQKNSSSEA